jgi:divalent metal cation (Fe/Co/Zn/Cd) transporter
VILSVYLQVMTEFNSFDAEQVGPLVGQTAPPQMLNQLTYIALKHHPELKVDTCRAFHVGANFFVEVDIVLPPDMPLIKVSTVLIAIQYIWV